MPPGTHLCTFYRGSAARDDIVAPFFAEGLRSNDKCIGVLESTDLLGLLARISAEVGVKGSPEIDVETSLQQGQLVMTSPAETYLRSGSFSADDMLEYWDTTMHDAVNVGAFRLARATGAMPDMSLVGQREFFRYEARLNQFIGRYPQVILCLYDLERFNAEVLMDTLRTHPRVLIDGTIHHNPYFIEPEDILGDGG